MTDKLYTPNGFLFHRFSRQLFLSSTEDLETIKPGIRAKIIENAYYQIIFCTNGIPEIFFILILLFTNSLLWSSLAFAITYISYALGNYYAYQMKYPILLGRLGKVWSYIKYFVLAALFFVHWHQRYMLTILITFGILQFWLRLGGTVFMLPIRLTLGKFLHKIFLSKNEYYPIEFIGLTFAIQSWRDKLVNNPLNPTKK
ncbi:MAG: hypothetical protein ABH952_07200 [Candidatus Omnitrophota bacterium]